ncbi:hypothetical protein QYE76_000308 [Lolium multiflorum]|uniref:DUF8039 domain-containing protein n=1 Tax=Lolium multiflorum TaxID=4521 RepID=A0AAD8RHJ5_LOLMU|nr:hypothetical protein QYE76_000308 [Lolium multiflorum]
MEDDDEKEEDNDMYPNYGDTATGHDEDEEAGGGEDEELSDEPVDDDLRRAIDAHRDENEKRKLKGMLDDHKKKLYPNCEDGNTKLGATLELLQWKAEAGICDKPFEKLLKIMKRRFPKDNELPDSTYEAKKVLYPLGLEVLKIHACINDCILYRAEYENLENARYAMHCGIRSGEMTLVMLRASHLGRGFLPRLCDRKKDEMLRHPADGSQWRTIDREFPDFADDAKNLRKLLVNFILPEPADSDSENDRPDPEDPELNSVQRRVKKWALKKMAVQFNDYKKKLDNFFVKKNKTPDFNGPYEKIKDHWEAFVKYKTSERAKKRSATNTQNAANKMYFHTMGRGGYKAGRPKWEKWENDLIEKGIQPEIEEVAFDATGQGSQRKSSVASTELPGNDADVDPHMAPPSPVDPHMAPPSPVDPQMAPRYPVDYITESTPCELHFKTMGYLTLKAAIGYVLPPVPDQRYHFKPVPHGYAVAGVDQVMDGYGPLRLDHPAGGGDLLELGVAKNTTVLWRKEFIVIPGWEKPRTLQSPPNQHSPPMQPSPVRQPSPPAREPSLPPREPSPPPSEPSPPPQATTQSKSKKRTATAMSRNRSPKRKQEPLPRVPKVPPKRPYDYTVEENAKIAKEQHMKSMFGKKKPQPEPEPAISKEKKLKLLKNLHQPEPSLSSNYDRSIRKSNVVAKERWQKSKEEGKQVPQLGTQKNSCPPLNVYPNIIDCLDPTLVALYKDEADANNMSIPEYLSRLEFIQTDDVQIAYQYKYGQLMTHKYRRSQQYSRELKPNLLIRHKGSQRIFVSLNNGVVYSAAPGNGLARKSLSVATVL